MGSEEEQVLIVYPWAHTHITCFAGERSHSLTQQPPGFFEILFRSTGDLGGLSLSQAAAMGRRWFLCLGLCLITWRLHSTFAGALQLGAASRGARMVRRVRERKVNREPRRRCVLFYILLCLCVFLELIPGLGKMGLNETSHGLL